MRDLIEFILISIVILLGLMGMFLLMLLDSNLFGNILAVATGLFLLSNIVELVRDGK